MDAQRVIFLSRCRCTGIIPAAVASILLVDGVEGAGIAGYLARRLGLI